MPLGARPGKARQPTKREPGNLPQAVTDRMRDASGAVFLAVVAIVIAGGGIEVRRLSLSSKPEKLGSGAHACVQIDTETLSCPARPR